MAFDPNAGAGNGAGITDLATNGKALNQLIALLVETLKGMFRVTGTFTMPAASSITVPQPATQATSFALPIAMNASAAALMAGANGLYNSGNVPGTSFTLSTAGGGAATGSEQFAYVLITPV